MFKYSILRLQMIKIKSLIKTFFLLRYPARKPDQKPGFWYGRVSFRVWILIFRKHGRLKFGMVYVFWNKWDLIYENLRKKQFFWKETWFANSSILPKVKKKKRFFLIQHPAQNSVGEYVRIISYQCWNQGCISYSIFPLSTFPLKKGMHVNLLTTICYMNFIIFFFSFTKCRRPRRDYRLGKMCLSSGGLWNSRFFLILFIMVLNIKLLCVFDLSK